MQAKILDGKGLAEILQVSQQERATKIERNLKRRVALCVILVGNDTPSVTYVGRKVEACRQVGIQCLERRLADTTTFDELRTIIDDLNHDKNIDGILVQLPLPKHINAHDVMSLISADKDVDGLCAINSGKMLQNNPHTIYPCTPLGIVRLLEHYKIPLEGKDVVVVGDSNIVGRPMAAMLLNARCTVTVCHKQTTMLAQKTRLADILIVAVGYKHLIDSTFVKEGAVVVDVGFNNINGRLYGDVDFDSVAKVASYITPVPRGVGPMTVSALLDNVLAIAESKIG